MKKTGQSKKGIKSTVWQGLPGLRRNDEGTVLVLSILALAILTIIGFAFLGLSFNENQITRMQRDDVQALFMADLGIEKALSELNQRVEADPEKEDFDFELTDNDGYLFGCVDGIDVFTVGSYEPGRYRVFMFDNNDGGGATDDVDMAVWARSEGVVTLRGHTQARAVQALLTHDLYAALTMGCGADADDTLTISGNPDITGSRASVHSNCDIDIPGNPNIDQNVSASDSIDIGGSPTIGGAQEENAPPVDIPEIDPADFAGLADYCMREAGGQATITDCDGNLVFDATGGGIWPGPDGWKFSGNPDDWGVWDYQGDTTPAEVQGKTFYFEKAPGTPPAGRGGNVTIGSNPGDPGDEWEVTILADGHIDISGNPYFDSNNHSLLLVAGTDIKMGGNYTAPAPGVVIIASHEQIDISGNPQFTGLVIAENAAADDDYIEDTAISGNPVITYNGAPRPPALWGYPIRPIAWREVSLSPADVDTVTCGGGKGKGGP